MGWLMGGVGCGSEERLGNGMGIGPVHGTFIRGPAVSASGGSMQKNLDASRLSVVTTSDVQFGFCLSAVHKPACIRGYKRSLAFGMQQAAIS